MNFLDESEHNSHEICKNILTFLHVSDKYETNKEKLSKTQMNFKLDLAKCGDSHDDKLVEQETDLAKDVQAMGMAIHH